MSRSIFRRSHWLDMLAAVVLLAGMTGVIMGYRSLRTTEPKVDALQPGIIRPMSTGRIRLIGRDLRPFAQVFLIKAGVPFVLHDPTIGYEQAAFFLLNSREAEIEVPSLPSGVYDLYLYDQGERVGRLPAALRVQADGRPGATIAATVRFLIPPEMAPLVRVGDRARHVALQDTTSGDAEIQAIQWRPGLVETVDFHPVERQTFAGPTTFSRVVNATVAIPVTQDDSGVWTYRGAPVRAGEDFTLETRRYVVRGLTLDVAAPK